MSQSEFPCDVRSDRPYTACLAKQCRYHHYQADHCTIDPVITAEARCKAYVPWKESQAHVPV